MADPPTSSQVHAVEVTIRDGVVTGRLVCTAIEANRGRAIVDAVRAAEKKAGKDLRAVVLDFGEVNFVNSSGIASLIELRNDAEARGVTMIAFRPNDELLQVFHKMKLDRLYTVALDEGELKDALKQG